MPGPHPEDYNPGAQLNFFMMLALRFFFPTSTLTTTFDVGPTSHYYLGYVFLWDVLLFACEKDFLQYIYKVSLWCVFSSSWLAILMWEASQVSFRSYIYKVSFAAISQWYYQWYCSLMITSRGVLTLKRGTGMCPSRGYQFTLPRPFPRPPVHRVSSVL